MAQPQLTPQRKKKHSIGRRIRRIVLLLLLVYAIVAVLPYAFPPKAQLAENWLENALSDANVDSATMLETGSEALDMRLRLIAGAQSSIQAGSYIYAMDESGTQVTAALLAAADRGVRVQLIIDGLIGFAASDMGAKVFGEEKAKEVLAHAEAIKAAGAKYCDCPACAACEAILKHKEELIG